MNKRVTITQDHVSRVIADIHALVDKQVLIGIPDSTTDRNDEVSGPMTNATLGYIHEFGSPAANIPARPFLIPGVKNVEEKALDKMKRAAEDTLRGDVKKADQQLTAAGIIAMGGAKAEIQYGDFEPLAPSTIRNRRHSRGTKSMRQSEEQYLTLVAGGMSPADAQAATGIRPLINTGQLRNALTFVVRGRR